MSDIQDEGYSEAMDEIKELKRRLDELGEKETYKEWQRNQAIIRGLKALLGRAAIVMEQEHLKQQEIKRFSPAECSTCAFIDQLREAAQ